ncbi:hypothetical protein [Halovenus salina]|uniref:Cox cluster protein n=1 Tax=Halovenus salina TaxID=1510225 RepID=A0ABD5VZK1_9EURY|nr:hypothetical protein [Halovenus salina]
MTADNASSEKLPVVQLTVVSIVFLSFIVVPGFVLGLVTYGWQSWLGFSNLHVGLVALAPGVLMGGAALLTMLGSR